MLYNLSVLVQNLAIIEGENSMKSKHSFSVNFFVRSNRTDFVRVPMYVRITVDGKGIDFSIKKFV